MSFATGLAGLFDKSTITYYISRKAPLEAPRPCGESATALDPTHTQPCPGCHAVRHKVKPFVLLSHRLFLASHPRASHKPTMSHNLPQIPSSENFQAIFDNALEVYKKKTGKDLKSDPLLLRLESCDSPDAVLDVLQEQTSAFTKSGSRTWVKPTINVLYTFSSTIGGGVSLVSMVKPAIDDRAITSTF